MKRLSFFLFCLLIAGFSIAQTFNRPIPPTLYAYEFDSYQSSPDGYYLMVPYMDGAVPGDANYIAPKPVILDKNGYVFWYMNSTNILTGNLSYYPDRELFSYSRSNTGVSKYQIMDLNFNVIDTFGNVNGILSNNHEFKILPNGNYVMSGDHIDTMDLSGYVFNGTQGSVNTRVLGFVIQEFDAMHNLVFEWNSNDYIHPSQTYNQYGYNVNRFDYCHGNSIEEDADGNLLVSFRHLNAVYKINHTTGAVIWQLGGKTSDFDFVNDTGFSGQHDIRLLPDGQYSLHDNGNMSPAPRKSRDLVFSLDTNAWTATKTFEYSHTPIVLGLAMGNHQITPEHGHLVNYGRVFRPSPSIVFIDSSSQPISEIIFRDTVISYRSYFYQIPFTVEQEAITCERSGTDILLTAPNGYSKYLWSTGDSTQSILISTAGTYQVWMNYGVGMLGSLPLTINNVAEDCSGAAIEEPSTVIKDDKLIGIYDLMGRQIADPVDGNIYILQYKNSKAKLVYWTRH
jgi:hypothetical protein